MPALHCERDRMCAVNSNEHTGCEVGAAPRACPTAQPRRSGESPAASSAPSAELLVQALQLECEKAVLRGRTDASGVKSWAGAVELSTSTELIPQAQHIQSLNVKLIFSLSIFFFFF